MREQLQRIVKSSTFQTTILGLILMAAVVVGLETYPSISQKYGAILAQINTLILWAFVVEAAFKMAQHGRHFLRYFKDPWNVFDFSIILVCVLPFHSSFAAVFRLARVIRALRLVTALPKLQLIVNCLLKSLPAMFYVGILLSLTFYVYAVVGVFLFRDNDPIHFRDLPTSLLTLFRVVTLEDWTDVMYVQMLGSDVYGNAGDGSYHNTSGIERASLPQPLVGAAFFVSFVLLGTMIILNLFIGVILSSMTEAQEDADREHLTTEQASGKQQSVVSEVDAIEGQIHDLKLSLQKLRLRLDSDGAEENPAPPS